MESKYTDGSHNRRPRAEEDALNGSAPRPKRASENRSSDRFHCECPGTHTTTTTRPRAAKPGNHEQRRQTPADANRRSTTKRDLDERTNHDVGPEKRLHHEEQPTETRARRTRTTASRTRERAATGHDVTEGRGQREPQRRSNRSEITSGTPPRAGRQSRNQPTEAGAGVSPPTSTSQGLLIERRSPVARDLVDLGLWNGGARVAAAETARAQRRNTPDTRKILRTRLTTHEKS